LSALGRPAHRDRRPRRGHGTSRHRPHPRVRAPGGAHGGDVGAPASRRGNGWRPPRRPPGGRGRDGAALAHGL
jgi:hypothetical protein